jgi:hypothetical protein
VCVCDHSDTLERRWWRVWRGFALAPYTHNIYIHGRTSMHVNLIFWVLLTADCLTLIRSRSWYNHTHQHAYLRVCLRTYFFFFCLFSEYTLQLIGLPHCFSSIQRALFVRQPVVGPANRRFCRAFIAWVSACLSCKVLSFYHYLTCICLCFLCDLCVCVSRCAPADEQRQ